MKKIILTICLLIPQLTFAASEDTDICEGIATVAENVMQQRQANISLQIQQNVILQFDGDSRDVYELIVEDAYEQPILKTDLGKQQMVDKFRKHYFELCMSEDS